MAVTVLRQLISLCLVMGLGYLLARKNVLDESTVKNLSVYFTKAALPITLVLVMQVEYSWQRILDLGIISLGMLVVTALGILVSLPVCKLFRVPSGEAGVWMAGATFSNAIFMGRPIMVALYGQDALFPISALMFSFNLLCFSVGMLMLTPREEGKKLSPKDILRPLLFNYAVIGALLGFLLFAFSIRLPSPVLGAMQMVSDTLSPLSMLIIGFSLSRLRVRDLFMDYRMYLISAMRLLVLPILSFYILRGFIHDRVLLGVLCVRACMPVASSVGVLSEQTGNHPELASKITFGSTLLCTLTAPLCMLLMQGGL